MFREMRRNAQQLSDNECQEILNTATSGVLAVHGDDDYPYTVPLSYVYDGMNIYFHCALVGHKIDAIVKNEKVSFCVISRDDIIPEEYTTYYKSVVVFGKARILNSTGEKKAAVYKLAKKYSPEQTDKDAVISESFDRFHIVKIEINHITGKQAIELTKN